MCVDMSFGWIYVSVTQCNKWLWILRYILLAFFFSSSSVYFCSRFHKNQHNKAQRRSSFYRDTGSLIMDADETTPLIVTNKHQEDFKGKKPEHPSPSLLKILVKTFGVELLQSHVWKLFYDALILTNPLVLGYVPVNFIFFICLMSNVLSE